MNCNNAISGSKSRYIFKILVKDSFYQNLKLPILLISKYCVLLIAVNYRTVKGPSGAIHCSK